MLSCGVTPTSSSFRTCRRTLRTAPGTRTPQASRPPCPHRGHVGDYYRAINAPPAGAQGFQTRPQDQRAEQYEGWHDLVKALAMHGVGRYGLATMRTFRFEVWDAFWGMPLTGNTTNFSPYMRLYTAAVAIKSVDSSLQVGGPSSNGGVCCIDTFVKVASAMRAPYNFVSGHIYPIESFCPDPDGGPG
eukprot:m.1465 g.1465  ORF g.1465 m.1465 type:complete len:188 (-) comp881_c0_seq1:838-1401(-)